jgi:uncharacterized protein YbjT (DUF2867 family)
VILVTAANGLTGRRVVDVLARTGEAVRAMDIAPSVKELEQNHQVEAVVGDLSDATSVREVMEGVRTVVFIGPLLHPQEADFGRIAVSEARRAGIGHFVYFSVLHPQLEGLPNHAAKLEVERHLLTSRMPFTILQPTYYMQSVNVALAAASGVLRQPFEVDTKIAHVDLENVATIAAQVVTNSAHHLSATYQLCGGDPKTSRELAEVIAAESGRLVRAEPSTIGIGLETGPGSTEAEDYRADALVRLIAHYERYGIDGNANVLTWLLGRRPTSFAEYVRRCLADPGPPPHAA